MANLKKLLSWFVDLFRVNKEATKENVIWYLLALGAVFGALGIAWFAEWQNGGEICPIYKGGVFVGTKVVQDPVLLDIRPDMQTFFWAGLMYLVFWLKRCFNSTRNPLILLLILCDVLLVASLIRSFLPAESVELFRVFGIKKLAVTVNPQHLVWFVIFFSLVSMRSISGFGIGILVIAFLSRMSQLNLQLGTYGLAYLVCTFVTFICQTRVAGLVPANGRVQMFVQDVGRAGLDEIKQDMNAVRSTVSKGVGAVASVVGVPTFGTESHSVQKQGVGEDIRS